MNDTFHVMPGQEMKIERPWPSPEEMEMLREVLAINREIVEMIAETGGASMPFRVATSDHAFREQWKATIGGEER